MKVMMKMIRGHVEVYDEAGRFLFSADSQHEAEEDISTLGL